MKAWSECVIRSCDLVVKAISWYGVCAVMSNIVPHSLVWAILCACRSQEFHMQLHMHFPKKFPNDPLYFLYWFQMNPSYAVPTVLIFYVYFPFQKSAPVSATTFGRCTRLYIIPTMSPATTQVPCCRPASLPAARSDPQTTTVQYRYNVVNFLLNPHNHVFKTLMYILTHCSDVCSISILWFWTVL